MLSILSKPGENCPYTEPQCYKIMSGCISPWKKDGYTLPCGKCYECKQRRVSGWSFRLLKEAERSSSAFFLTLTYDNDHVPMSQNQFMTLVKRDLQLFFKKLRRTISTRFSVCPKGIVYDRRLKYYACGEYGGKTFRPHYHIILFNCPLETLIGRRMAEAANRGFILLDGKREFNHESWDKGHITIGQVTAASVGYTLKYVCKPGKVPIHKRDDRLKEFSLMSKKMGSNYLSEKMVRWHHNDITNRYYVPLFDGKKIAMPRYYKDKIFSSPQRKYVAIQIQKREFELIHRKDALQIHREFKLKEDIRITKARWNLSEPRLSVKI